MLARRSYKEAILAAASMSLLFLASHHLGVFSPYYHVSRDGLAVQIPNRNVEHGARENQSTAFNAVLSHEYVETTATDPSCAWIPDTSTILLIMKTGASESFSKIPTQSLTTLRCLPEKNILVFSDLSQSIAGLDVYDSLETVLDEAMEGNDDFELYKRQQTCEVDQENCNKEADGSLSSAGWNLDKYKNIHIAEKAYHMRPGYDWYVTVDADTYVLWPNLVRWLSTLDPSETHYLGSVTMMGDFLFGHGGSGYVLSRAVMEHFVGNNPGIASKYDVKIKDTCCGDYMLAKALKDTTGIQVKNAWPTINGEKPFTLPYGPSHWCQPIVTMHHMNSEEISNFWMFEKQYYERQIPGANQSLLLKDIYKEFLEPRLEARRNDWDNLSEDVYYLDPNAHKYEDWQLKRVHKEDLSDRELNAHRSFQDCANMCDEVEDCYQFRFQNGICSYHKGFLLGHPKKKESMEEQRWMSGWPVGKIKSWVESHQVCEEIPWPKFS